MQSAEIRANEAHVHTDTELHTVNEISLGVTGEIIVASSEREGPVDQVQVQIRQTEPFKRLGKGLPNQK
jgi:hypothetical protein